MALESLVQQQIYTEDEVARLTPQQRIQLGELICDEIRDRCERGIDATGRVFRYAPNSEYRGNNLSLTGDMLTMLEIVSISDGITVGYTDLNSQEANQAENNNWGITHAWPKLFLGLPKSAKEKLLAKVRSSSDEDIEGLDSFAQAFISRLFQNQGQ